MQIELTDEEVLYLHDVLVHKIDTNASDLPECTWTDECFSCNLYNKFYMAFVEVRDRNENMG